MNNRDIADKVAIVTGAASGIGRATALRFADAGAKVVVSDVNEVGGEDTVDMIHKQGGEALFVLTNVADAGSVERMVKTAIDAYGRLDIGINNAGIGGVWAKTAEYPHDDWHQVLAVNLTGVFYCMQAELKPMLAQGCGAIVNTASVAGLRALDNAPAYAASKHGVIGLTRSAAREYAKRNIRINAVCPVFTRTPLFDETLLVREDLEERFRRMIPMQRYGEPRDIAEAIFWLASDASSFVTGQALSLDGGLTA